MKTTAAAAKNIEWKHRKRIETEFLLLYRCCDGRKEGEWNNKYDKSPEQIHSDVGEGLFVVNKQNSYLTFT